MNGIENLMALGTTKAGQLTFRAALSHNTLERKRLSKMLNKEYSLRF